MKSLEVSMYIAAVVSGAVALAMSVLVISRQEYESNA